MKKDIERIIHLYILLSYCALLIGICFGLSDQIDCKRYKSASPIRIMLPAFEAGCWLGSSGRGIE